MKRNKTWYWDLLSWSALYLLWIFVFSQRELAFPHTATVEFCYLLFISANYYYNALFVIPRFLYRKKYFSSAILFFAGIAIASLLRVPLAEYLNRNYFLQGRTQPGFSEIFVRSFLNISIWSIGVVSIKLITDRYRIQKYLEQVEKEKSKAELDFLNAQFNPHFLFNSINSIYSRIDKQNMEARNMLLTLSDMLRYQLYDCNHPEIQVEKEIEYVRNYVALQQERKGESLQTNLHVDERIKDFTIAPLLFIAFIENAFKYVSNGDEKSNRVDISFSKQNGAMIFTCFNTCDGLQQNGIEHSGIGIENVKRRLNLIYPERHELKIDRQKDHYHVTLKIQLS